MTINHSFRVFLQTFKGMVLDSDLLDYKGVNGGLGFNLVELSDPRVKIRSFNFSGGRSRELDKFTAGSATIVFDNRDGLFSPNNTSSPYYGAAYPGKPILVFYSDSGQSLFSGVISDVEYSFDPSGDAIATFHCADLFSLLANVLVPSTSAPQESTGARAQRIFNLAGLNPSQYVVDAVTYSTMAAETISGNALSLLQDVATCEQGQLYVYDQRLVFRGRNYDQLYPDFIINADTLFISGDRIYGAMDLGFAFSNDSVINDVTTVSALGTVNYVNTSAVTSYGRMAESYDTKYSSLLEQTNFGKFIATNYGAPQFRVNQASFSVDGVDFTGNSRANIDMVYLLSAPLALSFITFQPPGGATAITQYGQVTSWSHSVTPGAYNITVGFEPAVFRNTFRLDDFQLGLLDTSVLAF